MKATERPPSAIDPLWRPAAWQVVLECWEKKTGAYRVVYDLIDDFQLESAQAYREEGGEMHYQLEIRFASKKFSVRPEEAAKSPGSGRAGGKTTARAKSSQSSGTSGTSRASR